MSHCFTDDNLVTTLCSVYIKLHQSITYKLIDIESSKSNIKFTITSCYLLGTWRMQSMLVLTEEDLGPLQYLRWSNLWPKNSLMPFQNTVKKYATEKINFAPTKKHSKNTAWKFFFFQNKICHMNHTLYIFFIVVFSNGYWLCRLHRELIVLTG